MLLKLKKIVVACAAIGTLLTPSIAQETKQPEANQSNLQRVMSIPVFETSELLQGLVPTFGTALGIGLLGTSAALGQSKSFTDGTVGWMTIGSYLAGCSVLYANQSTSALVKYGITALTTAQWGDALFLLSVYNPAFTLAFFGCAVVSGVLFFDMRREALIKHSKLAGAVFIGLLVHIMADRLYSH